MNANRLSYAIAAGILIATAAPELHADQREFDDQIHEISRAQSEQAKAVREAAIESKMVAGLTAVIAQKTSLLYNRKSQIAAVASLTAIFKRPAAPVSLQMKIVDVLLVTAEKSHQINTTVPRHAIAAADDLFMHAADDSVREAVIEKLGAIVKNRPCLRTEAGEALNKINALRLKG